tara:strand:- start:366 stop:626 length:261 start_codon:yes stop_codon:yes gene_type:complete
MNYSIQEVAMNINGRISVLKIKVADETKTLATGTEVKAICFVKNNGDLGAIQFWTPEHIDAMVAEATELAGEMDSLKKTFAQASEG